jgi:hypothetical protein
MKKIVTRAVLCSVLLSQYFGVPSVSAMDTVPPPSDVPAVVKPFCLDFGTVMTSLWLPGGTLPPLARTFMSELTRLQNGGLQLVLVLGESFERDVRFKASDRGIAYVGVSPDPSLIVNCAEKQRWGIQCTCGMVPFVVGHLRFDCIIDDIGALSGVIKYASYVPDLRTPEWLVENCGLGLLKPGGLLITDTATHPYLKPHCREGGGFEMKIAEGVVKNGWDTQDYEKVDFRSSPEWSVPVYAFVKPSAASVWIGSLADDFGANLCIPLEDLAPGAYMINTVYCSYYREILMTASRVGMLLERIRPGALRERPIQIPDLSNPVHRYAYYSIMYRPSIGVADYLFRHGMPAKPNVYELYEFSKRQGLLKLSSRELIETFRELELQLPGDLEQHRQLAKLMTSAVVVGMRPLFGRFPREERLFVNALAKKENLPTVNEVLDSCFGTQSIVVRKK